MRLKLNVRQSEADSMARDYLPKDAIEQIRRNRERDTLRSLPDPYRDMGGISKTILDGVALTMDREIGEQQGGIGGWVNRWRIRARTWTATREISSDLHDRVARDERAQSDRVRQSSEIVELVEILTRLNHDGIECLRLREQYGAQLESLGLSDRRREEALAVLDAIVNFHLTLLVNEIDGASDSIRVAQRNSRSRRS